MALGSYPVASSALSVLGRCRAAYRDSSPVMEGGTWQHSSDGADLTAEARRVFGDMLEGVS
jgi:hypothetical protein